MMGWFNKNIHSFFSNSIYYTHARTHSVACQWDIFSKIRTGKNWDLSETSQNLKPKKSDLVRILPKQTEIKLMKIIAHIHVHKHWFFKIRYAILSAYFLTKPSDHVWWSPKHYCTRRGSATNKDEKKLEKDSKEISRMSTNCHLIWRQSYKNFLVMKRLFQLYVTSTMMLLSSM